MQRHRVLDALLAEEELMPCTFAVDAADLGYLDPLAAQQQHLAAGTQVGKQHQQYLSPTYIMDGW